MEITKENKILIRKFIHIRRLAREFPCKSWNLGSVYKLLQKLDWSTVVPAAAADTAPAQLITSIFVDESYTS